MKKNILRIQKYILFLFVISFLTDLMSVQAQTERQLRSVRDILESVTGNSKSGKSSDTRALGDESGEFEIRLDDEDEEKADLSKFLGFSDDLERFGQSAFRPDKKYLKLADDAHVPDNYLIGLGDEIIIQYYGAENAEYTKTVDRSGNIILPDIGPITLNGLTLGQARKIISSNVGAKLVGVDVFVTIGKTKSINVFVAGHVINPGVYALPSMSRITQAIILAGGISDIGSYRSILHKRNGKLINIIDLYDILVSGDNSSDANLRSNDVIFVEVAKGNIQIVGAVKNPKIFEFKEDDTLSDLINFAGGGAPGSDLNKILYSSLTSEIPTKTININESKKYNFYDGDSLVVNFKPTSLEKINNSTIESASRSAIKVKVEGHVKYPGTYLMEQGSSLSDLIAQSGGPDTQAFLDGAIFTRSSVRKKEAYRARELANEIRRMSTSYAQTQAQGYFTQDVSAITEQLEDYEGIGRVIIDLPRALAGRSDADIELLNGDAVFIPPQNNTITVYGEVRRQSSYIFSKSYDIEDYVSLAAGVTQIADESSIYIVKANGNIIFPDTGWFSFNSNKTLSPGDTIVVPIDHDYRQSLPFWRDVISIIYQGAVAVAAVNGL